MRAAVKHPDILVGYDMYHAALDMPELDKVGFESKDPGVTKCKALRRSFPVDPPLWPRAPTMLVDEERELGVVEQKFAIETLDMDRPDAFLASDKVQRSIGLVEQRLGLQSLQGHDLEALRTCHAELGLEEVNGGGFGGDIALLERPQFVLTTTKHLAESLLFRLLRHCIIRLVDLDCRRQSGRLDHTYKVATQANTCFEEVAMALNLLGPPRQGRFVGIEGRQAVREKRFVRQHKEKLVLFQDLDLGHARYIEHPLRSSILDLAV